MKKIFALLSIICITNIFAQTEEQEFEKMLKIGQELKYQTGTIHFSSGNATLNVPKGFKFLDGPQTQKVLKDIWGNPEDTTILGSILPEDKGVLGSDSWMFIINYVEDGFVKDGDADDINYDDLLKDMKEEITASNPDRTAQGFPSIDLIGWASKPFYDKNLKVLHWAKELKFGTDESNTLNYDLRVLGRKGMYNISAVAGMAQLNEVKKSIPLIIKSVQYNEGFKYSDFDEDNDHVAEWTIGGLIAGKVLAKVGFFAILAKFGKFIVIGLIAGFGVIKKFFFGNKEQQMTKPEVIAPKNEDETTLEE
ncbi:DUF2167 domain-containing protein [Flavobacterium terrigena]|uniref:Uncharacterized membrane-anchored protein n=1 Tax=Flavobacterium terrigena TaxID=402734 RepID=A0A1H6QLF5_9FLAO|nr:DUF2167 domain-containing protein [Flavobacterium terrigena]SEI44499.1 Uncharacterized membrane-anchored protein [Flavobacterium terrigena]